MGDPINDIESPGWILQGILLFSKRVRQPSANGSDEAEVKVTHLADIS